MENNLQSSFTMVHIKEELQELLGCRVDINNSVVANFTTTAADGKTYKVDYYNPDAIISIGYRVNSIRGTHFRKWASGVLKEFMIKGFALEIYALSILSDTTQQNISLHITGILSEGELLKEATHKDFLLVRNEGNRSVKRQIDNIGQTRFFFP